MCAMPEQMLKTALFTKRGPAFFRIHGDGILQIIKCEKRKIKIGLFSMYSELQPQWFTSSGCIPRNSIEDIADQIVFNQSEFLATDGIPWLDTIDTQRKMLDALLGIESKHGQNIHWIDELKIAPFLMCQDYSSAEKVLTAILDNHRIAREVNKALYTNVCDYQRYAERRIKEDLRFLTMLDLVQQRNEHEIRNILTSNYIQNTRFGRFCAAKK